MNTTRSMRLVCQSCTHKHDVKLLISYAVPATCDFCGQTAWTAMCDVPTRKVREGEISVCQKDYMTIVAALKTAYNLVIKHHNCNVIQEPGDLCSVCHRDGKEPEMDEIVGALQRARKVMKEAINSRSKGLLDAWDRRIDSLRDEAHRCRANGNALHASHLEGKANAYATAYKELSASGNIQNRMLGTR